MKKRLKGLSAILVVMCLMLGLGITAMASNFKYIYNIPDGYEELGFTNLENSTILYEGDYIRDSEKSGERLVIINNNGDSLLTDGIDLYYSNNENSIIKVDQKATKAVEGVDFNGNYLLPENTSGYHGYTCDISNTSLPPEGPNDPIPSNIKLTVNNEPVNVSDVEFLTTSNTDSQYRVIILTLTEIPITYTLSFNGNNGTVTNNEASLEFGTTDKLTEVPTRTGYKFTGWNTKADGTGISISKDATASELTAITDITFNTRIRSVTSATNPITLYAQWEELVDNTPLAPATTEIAETETVKTEIADTADNNIIALPVAFTFASACAIVVINKKRHSM